MRQFVGKTALVTGASSGVGRAVAMALAKEGAAVSVLGRRQSELDATVSLIKKTGAAEVIRVVADVRMSTDVEKAVAETSAVLGNIDFVVNAAGVVRLGTILTFSEEDWDLLFDTNVKGAFLVSRSAIPTMQAKGGGAIVNIASVFAFAAVSGAAVYAASKAALVSLTRTIALDHARDGIRINCVAPGTMETPMLTALAEAMAPNDPKSVIAASARAHPIGRLVRVDEVASLVLYLLSDQSRAIIGSTFTIDGGRLAKLG
jgi:NAD(P)-dependent dehydrogenase (short-subunit alcohol dehydrogenase family)